LTENPRLVLYQVKREKEIPSIGRKTALHITMELQDKLAE
jgi:Holliday junction resolvasome RuvABC DNA-binding subunit